MNKPYRPRVIDAAISNRLRSIGAILLEGAKWCGKTTTGEHHANSAIFMDDPRKRDQYLLFSEENPDLILDGPTPRLIDEWQLAPRLWDSVRFTVDHRPGMGQFILSGSAKPADCSQIYHSGAGRFAWLKMRPMTLLESGDSGGQVSISALFDNPSCSIGCETDTTLERMAFLACRGGWPQAVDLDPDVALNPAIDYFNAVVNVDICRVDGVERSPDRARLLMRSYARFQGAQTPVSQIVSDMNGGGNNTVDDRTVSSYIDALRSIFVIEDMPAWNPNLTSKTAIRTADTRYFTDPSIAAAALGFGPGDLLNDMFAFGFMFETMCVRDLRVYSQAIGGQVSHFRDKNGLECDAVIHLPDGRFGLVEIKLGGEKGIALGAENLKKLASKIDTARMPAPSFMMVLTAASAFAYRRKDGVIVAPLSVLGV